MEEPCLNLKQIVSYEVKTAMWFWLRATLKGISGAELFKWLCFTKVSKCLLEEHMDWKGKDTHSSLKTECTSVLVGKAHMNPGGTPAVTRLQTFTNWVLPWSVLQTDSVPVPAAALEVITSSLRNQGNPTCRLGWETGFASGTSWPSSLPSTLCLCVRNGVCALWQSCILFSARNFTAEFHLPPANCESRLLW